MTTLPSFDNYIPSDAEQAKLDQRIAYRAMLRTRNTPEAREFLAGLIQKSLDTCQGYVNSMKGLAVKLDIIDQHRQIREQTKV